jgi:hypothetical protein
MNPAAIHLLINNKIQINWTLLSLNEAIFTYNYRKIKENKANLNKEFIEFYMHPKRMNLWIDDLND